MKSIHFVALVGTAATLVIAGCEKKPVSSKVDTTPPTPPAEKISSASGTPESANTAPMEKKEAAGSGIPVAPIPGGPASPPTGDDAFSSEATRILELPAGSERDDELGKFVRNSMHGGFERTEEWIHKMPAGPTRDTAYSAFIEDLGNVAPMLALDYTRHISDPEKRASLEARLQAKPRLVRPSEPEPGASPETPPTDSDRTGQLRHACDPLDA